jgi:aryl-alcohol dehydrogenase-like predicted oxidoreductase
VESLRRLQTDYVDVLALHEAQLADVRREDVLRALDNIVSKGYARTICLAGDLDVGLEAIALSERVRIIQVANNPFTPNVALAKLRLPPGRCVGFVTHSVYGHDGSLDALTAILARQADKRALMDSSGYCGTPRESAVAFLLDFALASNTEGVVLLSMYKPSHLDFDIGRLKTSPASEVVLDLASRLMASHPPLSSEEGRSLLCQSSST